MKQHQSGETGQETVTCIIPALLERYQFAYREIRCTQHWRTWILRTRMSACFLLTTILLLIQSSSPTWSLLIRRGVERRPTVLGLQHNFGRSTTHLLLQETEGRKPMCNKSSVLPVQLHKGRTGSHPQGHYNCWTELPDISSTSAVCSDQSVSSLTQTGPAAPVWQMVQG